ncbi:MAG: lipopolysaccharide biosynthesis protein, partial [Deltaproteobacteria bacterium]|nr:lipopolysaccharide biosynthesis protein [Deltaproteobacteria bacterium]
MSSTKSHWPLSLLGGGVSLLNMFLPMILVRTLAPEAIGHYKIFFLYLMVMPLLFMSAGITNGLSYCVGYDEKKTAAFRNSWTILLVIASMVLASGIISYPALIKWLDWNPYFLRLFIWSAFVQILATFFEEATIASGQIWRGALFLSGFDLLRNMSMLSAALVYGTIEAVFWANMIVVTIKVALGFIIGYREGFQRFDWNPEFRKGVLRYAFPVSLSGVLTIVTNYNDQFLLTSMIPPAAFAMYSMGCLSLPPLLILEQAVNRVLIPRMSKAFATGRGNEASQLLREATSELSWLFIPSATGLFVFADPIITLLFTKAYLAAAIFLKISAFRWMNLALPFDAVARARGKSGWIFRQYVIFSIISTCLVIALAKAFGATGAILGSVTAGYLMRFAAIGAIKKAEGWSLKEMLPWNDWGRYYFFALVASGAALLIKPYIGDGTGGRKW